MTKSLAERSVIDMEEAQDIKSLREALGLTLDDVFKATRISVKNLKAIEQGDFHLLPPPIYVKAYFKSYAHLLGVDEKLLIGPYEKNLTVSALAVDEDIDEIPTHGSFFSKKMIMNAAAVFVLFVLGFFSYIYLNSPVADVVLDSSLTTNSNGKPLIDKTNSAVSNGQTREVPVDGASGAEEKSMQTVGMPTTVNSEATTATAMKSPVKKPVLVIVAREKTWLRITEDQQEAYELLMAPGERIERSALQYNIDVGNAGGISVQFQGNSMNALGKSGEVVHLRLP